MLVPNAASISKPVTWNPARSLAMSTALLAGECSLMTTAKPRSAE